jgi:hypothetical protein
LARTFTWQHNKRHQTLNGKKRIMDTKNIHVINSFRLLSAPGLKQGSNAAPDSSITQKTSEMEVLAETYNFDQHPVRLHFFGDSISDLKFRIECLDPSTTKRLTEVLKQYLRNRS